MKHTIYGACALVIVTSLAGAASAQDRRGAMDFSDLDVTGDGIVTEEDITARRAERFAEMDANSDGQVDAEEFAAFSSARAAERAATLFERLDADGDGLVSRDALEARGGGRNIGRMIRRFDEDGDGGLNEAEFETAKARVLDRMGERRGKRH